MTPIHSARNGPTPTPPIVELEPLMRSLASILLFGALALCSTAPALAQDHAPIRALSKADDARWISTVRTHRTQDGSTVAEVLAYVERMRPRRFKAGSFEVAYNGATGMADTVAIGYWLGARRAPGDSYVDLGYDLTPAGAIRSVAADEVMTTALEAGRQAFLRAVDEAYRRDCHPDPRDLPDC